MKKSVKNIVCAATVAGVATFAAAQPAAAADLSATAVVTKNCDVASSSIDFGDIDSRSSSNTDQASTVSVTCTKDVSFEVAADKGAGGEAATITNRKMKNAGGTNFMDYALYTNSARSVIWGDGSTGNGTKLTGTGTGVAQTVDFYGRVPGGQTNVPAGSYSDTVVVTVTAL